MYLKKAAPRKITNDTLLLIMGLLYPAVHNYIWQAIVMVTRRFGLYFSNQLFDGFVWLFVLCYVASNMKKLEIKTKTLIGAFVYLLVIFVSFALSTYEYFTSSVLWELIKLLFFFLLGARVMVDNASHKQLFYCSIVTLVISSIYAFYSVTIRNNVFEDNMDMAYNVLPSVLIIISWLFTDEKKLLAIVFTVAGVLFMLLQGTRGPMLCMAVFICLMIYKKYGMGKFLVRVGTIVIIASLLLSSQTTKILLLRATEKIDSTGFSSRFLVKMIEGEIADNNGRDIIYETLMDDIKEEPLKVRGLFADRNATRGLHDKEYSMTYRNGTYAHNILLEVIYQWGALLGTGLLVLLGYAILKCIKQTDRRYSYIIMTYISVGFVQLFLSSSYLRSPHFFFLVGLLLSNIVPKIKERVGTKYERSGIRIITERK